MKSKNKFSFFSVVIILITLLTTACQPVDTTSLAETQTASAPTPTVTSVPPTPLATRPVYEPGQPWWITLHNPVTPFRRSRHISIQRSRDTPGKSNPPQGCDHPSPGFADENSHLLRCPLGKFLPDPAGFPFVNGPAQTGFDTVAFVNSRPGWLKSYTTFAGEKNRIGGEVVDYVAITYSVSPRLLLAIAEYQAGALSNPTLPDDQAKYPLGYADRDHVGLYMQLVWAANTLNNGYYRWREGTLDTISRLDDSIEHPDPWQNAATVAIQYYFSQLLDTTQYQKAVYSDGLAKTYIDLFGNPWSAQPHIEGSLTQPDWHSPFTG